MFIEVEARRVEPGITVLSFAGRLTLGHRLTEVEHALKQRISGGERKLVLDLSRLDFLDSAGIGMLVVLAGAMEQVNGKIRLAGANERIRQIFAITHLDRVIPIDPDAETACRWIAESSLGIAPA
jgi:anti-sigma B factor antagonist